MTALSLNVLCSVWLCINFSANQIIMEGQFLIYTSGNNTILKNSERKNYMHLRSDSGQRPKQFSYQVQNSLLFYKEFSFHCSTIITFFFTKYGYGHV